MSFGMLRGNPLRAAAVALAAPLALISGPLSAAQCVKPVEGFELITKAPVDECFNGVGKRYPKLTGETCAKGEPKRNEAYVWGLAKTGSGHLYWGTVANSPCVFFGGLGDSALPVDVPPLYAPENGWVCEFDKAWYSKQNPQLGKLGDWRPASIYRMNACTQQVEELTPNTDDIDDLLGIRAAGTVGNLVLMGGPGGVQEGMAGPNEGNSVYMYAYEAKSGKLLGSKKFDAFINVRQFITHQGVLYSGMTLKGNGNGQIVRWSGNPKNPFAYKVVGTTKSRPDNFAIHEGRLFASTWPNVTLGAGKVKAKAGVIMSPVIPAGGLTPAYKKQWQTVWTVDEYEPDRVTAASYAGGAIQSWKGQLYWGTMHFPTASLLAHYAAYGATWDSPEGFAATVASTHRATAVFRGKDFGNQQQKVELLYGESALMAYYPKMKAFGLTPTKAGPPRFGASGFGSPFNAYVWESGITAGHLYMGTFDSSRIWSAAIEALSTSMGLVPQAVLDQLKDMMPDPQAMGADLYRFEKPNQAAVAADLNGGGNSANYGYRTMINEKKSIWLGTANPFNLDPKGGWEIMRYTPVPPAP